MARNYNVGYIDDISDIRIKYYRSYILYPINDVYTPVFVRAIENNHSLNILYLDTPEETVVRSVPLVDTIKIPKVFGWVKSSSRSLDGWHYFAYKCKAPSPNRYRHGWSPEKSRCINLGGVSKRVEDVLEGKMVILNFLTHFVKENPSVLNLSDGRNVTNHRHYIMESSCNT